MAAGTPKPEAYPVVFQDAKGLSDETLHPEVPSPGHRAALGYAVARIKDGVARARAPAASKAPELGLEFVPGQVIVPRYRSPSLGS